jgi:hypothetical protein
MTRTIGWCGVAVAACLGLAAPAAAFDLDGTWAGKVTCRGRFNGAPQTMTSTSTLLVEDDGSSLELAVDGVHYSGASYPLPARPDKGEVAVIRCDTNSTRSADFGGEFGRLKVGTSASKGTGSLSGTSFKASVLIARSVFTCHWAFKRISIVPVALEGCTAPTPQ